MSQTYYTGSSIFSAGGVLVNPKDNKVYLVKKETSDEWLLPKGHLDEGEKPFETAEREVFEETGYRSLIKGLLGVQVRPDIHDETKTKVVFWFSAELIDETQESGTQEEWESFSGDWFEKNEAIEKLTYDSDKELVRLAFAK